jgi:hypothetical protein
VNNELTIMWKESVTEGRALWSVFLTKYYSSEQMKNGKGGAFSMCEGETHTELVKIFMCCTRSRR